jgi:hypothetical protein
VIGVAPVRARLTLSPRDVESFFDAYRVTPGSS